MIKQITSLLLVLGTGLMLTGCNYQKVETNGRLTLEDVQKFDRLLQKTRHEIYWPAGLGGPLGWHSIGVLYGRYIIYMAFEIQVEPNSMPRKTSDVTLSVYEYNSDYMSKKLVGSLTQEQWSKVDTTDNIFNFLNYTPIKNIPEEIDEDALQF